VDATLAIAGLVIALAVLVIVAARQASAIRAGRAAAVRQRAATDAAEATLARQRSELERLLEVVGPGVLHIDPDLRVQAANGVAHELLGRTPRTLVGRTVMEAFLDATVETTVRGGLASGSAATEIRPSGPDGTAIAIRIVRRPDGGGWVFLDDVGELRRLQRIRAEFIDNLSHELRTPLTTVSLLAETLSRDAATAGDAIPDKMRDRIAKVEVETGHLVQMVNELLDLSRIESGGTLRLVDGVDLGPLAADAAERLRLFAERQGVELRTDVGPDRPTVHGDAARLGQVVVNLVHNAVKFSPDGGVVTVSVRGFGGEVVVAVEDHGVGIPRAAQDRVFERFYKVDRARQRPELGGGTGLGLAIARHVIEGHGGRIWVESEEGRGSTFRFALPAATAPSLASTSPT
jgi:two-component system phosphate regulon sensor histidine kinase PhoR